MGDVNTISDLVKQHGFPIAICIVLICMFITIIWALMRREDRRMAEALKREEKQDKRIAYIETVALGAKDETIKMSTTIFARLIEVLNEFPKVNKQCVDIHHRLDDLLKGR